MEEGSSSFIDSYPSEAVIKVVGVGGGGGNAINRMIRSGIGGVYYIAMNTDVQALYNSTADERLALGKELTGGLGAGGNPEIGKEAAEESKEEIKKALQGANMVFITTGMGGGTGTGAAPIVAEIAKSMGILTVAVVTTPFIFEGKKKVEIAFQGIEKLKPHVDTLIQVPNEQLLRLCQNGTSMKEALLLADDVLLQGISGISELITEPGEINIDFADVKSALKNSGDAIMGIGEGEGENRAIDAVKSAISNPLLKDASINGARNVLINVAAGDNLTLQEYQSVVEYVRSITDIDALVKPGQSINTSLGNKIRVTVVATGFAPHISVLEAQIAEMRQKGSFVNTSFERDSDGVKIIRHWQELCPQISENINYGDYSIPAVIRYSLGPSTAFNDER